MGTWHEGTPYPGASLLDVVRHFREDTLLLWWALILHRRVIFCGQPAHKVGNCCLAAPLLVAPLGGFGATLAPHVPLSHPQRIEDAPPDAPLVCGVTNQIFEMWSARYDAIAMFKSGRVRVNGELSRIKPSGRPLRFIRSVVQAVERDGRGEAYVGARPARAAASAGAEGATCGRGGAPAGQRSSAAWRKRRTMRGSSTSRTRAPRS